MTLNQSLDRFRLTAAPLPGIDSEDSALPYGARSAAGVIVGDLLMQYVPTLARGEVEIVSIARRPGVLTKVAVARRRGVKLTGRPVGLVVGVGADYVRQVRAELDGERVHILQWQGDPVRYVAGALELGYLPPIQLDGISRLANVLLGEIDKIGMRGPQGVNLLLASALTGWRIRLRSIRNSPAWRLLDSARDQRRSVPGVVEARAGKGLSVSVYGLNALLPTGRLLGVGRDTPPNQVDFLERQLVGKQIQVVVLRLDADEGKIFVAQRVPQAAQLQLL